MKEEIIEVKNQLGRVGVRELADTCREVKALVDANTANDDANKLELDERISREVDRLERLI